MPAILRGKCLDITRCAAHHVPCIHFESFFSIVFAIRQYLFLLQHALKAVGRFTALDKPRTPPPLQFLSEYANTPRA